MQQQCGCSSRCVAKVQRHASGNGHWVHGFLKVEPETPQDTIAIHSDPFLSPLGTGSGDRMWQIPTMNNLLNMYFGQRFSHSQAGERFAGFELVELKIFRAPKTFAVSESTGLRFSSGNVTPFADASTDLNSSIQQQSTSFRLQGRRRERTNCPCFMPIHQQCALQMVGLLVGGGQLKSLLLLPLYFRQDMDDSYIYISHHFTISLCSVVGGWGWIFLQSGSVLACFCNVAM